MGKEKKIKKANTVQFSVIINDIKLPKTVLKEIEDDINNVVAKHLNRQGGLAGYLAVNDISKIIPSLVPDPKFPINGFIYSGINSTNLKQLNKKIWQK